MDASVGSGPAAPASRRRFPSSANRETPPWLKKAVSRGREALPLDPASQVSGGCLAGLDVGLIEGIDSQDRSGHRGGHLPSKDLLPRS